jgi:hypothetical protein
MNITMQNLERLSLAEMKEFVEGNREVRLSMDTREETYGLVEATLHSQQYRKLSKGQKRYLFTALGPRGDGACVNRAAESWQLAAEA